MARSIPGCRAQLASWRRWPLGSRPQLQCASLRHCTACRRRAPAPPRRIAAWDRKCHRERGLLTARTCSRRDRRSNLLFTAPQRPSGYVAVREQLWQLIPVQEDNPFQWANILGQRVSVLNEARNLEGARCHDDRFMSIKGVCCEWRGRRCSAAVHRRARGRRQGAGSRRHRRPHAERCHTLPPLHLEAQPGAATTRSWGPAPGRPGWLTPPATTCSTSAARCVRAPWWRCGRWPLAPNLPGAPVHHSATTVEPLCSASLPLPLRPQVCATKRANYLGQSLGRRNCREGVRTFERDARG